MDTNDEATMMQQEEMFADYVDYLFCERLVNGMQRKVTFTHDVRLRYENQALIDHILATRHDKTDSINGISRGSRRTNSGNNRNNTASEDVSPPSSPPPSHRPQFWVAREEEESSSSSSESSIEDDMIFDMEL